MEKIKVGDLVRRLPHHSNIEWVEYTYRAGVETLGVFQVVEVNRNHDMIRLNFNPAAYWSISRFKVIVSSKEELRGFL